MQNQHREDSSCQDSQLVSHLKLNLTRESRRKYSQKTESNRFAAEQRSTGYSKASYATVVFETLSDAVCKHFHSLNGKRFFSYLNDKQQSRQADLQRLGTIDSERMQDLNEEPKQAIRYGQ